MGGSSGSSGGGGGGSGIVDYPDYMKDFHEDLLNDGGADTLTSSIVDIMNAALGNSPFSGVTAYDPDADIAANAAAVADFVTLITGIDEPVDWAALYAAVVAEVDGVIDAEIVADVTAFGDELDDQIVNTVLPRFEAGMRNINAVMSSAFVLGEAIIEGFRDRDVAKHSSKLRIASIIERSNNYIVGTGQLLNFLIQKYSWSDTIVKNTIESNRIKIVAKKEQADVDLNIEESDAIWDISLFQHGNNALSSIGGSAVSPESKKSPASSMLGGAMTGAAAGFMLGGPGGALAGGLLGAASSFL